MTDLTLTDFQVDNGGSVSSLTNTGTGQYSVVVAVTPLSGSAVRGLTKVTLKNGAAYDAQLRGSTKFEHTIDFVEAVTRYADLEGWWKFEDNLNDSSGNDRSGAHSGTNQIRKFRSSTGKFGKGSVSWTVRVSTLPLPDIRASLALLREPCRPGLKQIKGPQRFLIGVTMLNAQKWTFRTQTENGVSGAHPC